MFHLYIYILNHAIFHVFCYLIRDNRCQNSESLTFRGYLENHVHFEMQLRTKVAKNNSLNNMHFHILLNGPIRELFRRSDPKTAY